MHDFALKHVARELAEPAGVPVLTGSGLAGALLEELQAMGAAGVFASHLHLLQVTGRD